MAMQRSARTIRLRKDCLTKAKKLSDDEFASVQGTLRPLFGGYTTPGLYLQRNQGSERLRSLRTTNDIRMVVQLAGSERMVLRMARQMKLPPEPFDGQSGPGVSKPDSGMNIPGPGRRIGDAHPVASAVASDHLLAWMRLWPSGGNPWPKSRLPGN